VSEADYDTAFIQEFRANAGHVGGPWTGYPARWCIE